MHRYLAYIASLLLLALSIWFVSSGYRHWAWGVLVFGISSALGTFDLIQRTSTLRRNYPLLVYFRYALESIGPEIRQYFIQRDTEPVPFSREQRALVYRRSKSEQETVPFGSLLNPYTPQYEWINHSITPSTSDDHDYRVVIGGNGEKAYSASVFNISAMSFGALSANAIRALNAGAKAGGFYHDTGEGSISIHHRQFGGDLVWEIGSGYFGCRRDDGGFDPERFARQATDPQVKMIELKLSQGAKPGHGGMLPAAKVTPEIAAARGVPVGVNCISPAGHRAFSTPIGLLEFIARMRVLAGGKPVGFKLAIGHPWEWFGIAKAMLETGLKPDFIVVDGAEGGTGAAPAEFINHVGVPMNEGLLLVHNTLVGLGIRDQIKVGAAGQIISAFDIARTIALGADWCNSARGFMFALGCIQSMSCHTDRCPTGIATQDGRRSRKLDIADKSMRVQRFHQNTLRALHDLLCAAGLTHPSQLGPEHILRRVSQTQISSLASMYRYLRPGELLAGRLPEHAVFQAFWADARADTFTAPETIGRLRASKLV